MKTRNDDGFVGGIEGLVFGVLVFVLGVLVVANAWAVVDAKLAMTGAAREATRAFVESPATTTGDAYAAAVAAAEDAVIAQGRSVDRFRLDAPAGLVLERCARVELVARYRVPLVSVPLLGRFGPGIEVAARHAEVVDPYRSGVPGEQPCA